MKPSSSKLVDTWRHGSTAPFALLGTLILAVVMSVHLTLLRLESANLPLRSLMERMQCPDGGSDLSTGGLPEEKWRPPSYFGLGVWVDSEALLPGVHSALHMMEERLMSGEQHQDPGSPTDTSVPPVHSLHHFVRLQKKDRDEATASLERDVELIQKDTTKAPSAMVADVDAVARRHISGVASLQQLGLPTLQHAFAPDIGQDTRMFGISIFSVPAAFLGSRGDRVHCSIFNVGQAYCIVPLLSQSREEGDKAYRLRATSLDAEVRAALLSVMTKLLHLSSFRADDIAAWKRNREAVSCRYTIASMEASLRTIETNTNMAVPWSMSDLFATIERHVDAKKFILAARAADDLQFHPLLTPQLYMPWDHSVVSQLIILLPIISIWLLFGRFWIDEMKSKKKVAAAAAKAKKEQ